MFVAMLVVKNVAGALEAFGVVPRLVYLLFIGIARHKKYFPVPFVVLPLANARVQNVVGWVKFAKQAVRKSR